MRTCGKCNDRLPYKIWVDGKQKNIGNRRYCLECSPWGQHNTRKLNGHPRRPYDSTTRSAKGRDVVEWRKRVKLKAVAQKGGKCICCGYSTCIGALTFHHIDPTTKEFNISGTSYSWLRIQNELEKCVLVCMNCHAEIENGIRCLPPTADPNLGLQSLAG